MHGQLGPKGRSTLRTKIEKCREYLRILSILRSRNSVALTCGSEDDDHERQQTSYRPKGVTSEIFGCNSAQRVSAVANLDQPRGRTSYRPRSPIRVFRMQPGTASLCDRQPRSTEQSDKLPPQESHPSFSDVTRHNLRTMIAAKSANG